MRRDTGAAVALGVGVASCASLAGGRKSASALKKDPVLGFFSADQIVANPAGFRKAVSAAIARAKRTDAIVTIGIKPECPATGFGYVNPKSGQFVEKPNEAKAKTYLKKGFLWNAGMFIWRAKTLETAFAAAAPDIESIINPLAKAKNPQTALRKLYPGIKSISFDYAVMEKIRNILVTKCSFDWDDVGSWLSFSEHFDADGRGNRRIGRTAVYETSNSTVVSDGSHLVAVAGLRDVVVVRTKDATLVMSADMADKMKALCDSFMPADGK